MPDLGNLSLSATFKLSHCSSYDALDTPVKTLTNDFGSKPAFEPRVLKCTRGSLDRVKKPPTVDKAFQDRLKDPFLVGGGGLLDQIQGATGALQNPRFKGRFGTEAIG